ARELRLLNTALWEIEDEIREHEAKHDFGARFVTLARSVYQTNDKRAAVKNRINQAFGSAIVEEKSYKGGWAYQFLSLILRSVGPQDRRVSKDGPKGRQFPVAILRDARAQSARAPQDEAQNASRALRMRPNWLIRADRTGPSAPCRPLHPRQP